MTTADFEELLKVLDVTQVEGVTTNLGFLRAACASPAFREVRLDTGWLDREGTAALAAETAAVLCYVSALVAMPLADVLATPGSAAGPIAAPSRCSGAM